MATLARPVRADEYDGEGEGSWVLLEATGREATGGEAGPSEL